MGKVKVIIQNGGLGGTLQTDDGVCGKVLTGGIDGGGYVLGTPVLLTSYSKLADKGITSDGNAFALKEVQEFYDMAGDGAELYLMLVENTQTISMMADKDNVLGASVLLDFAKGNIKLLGLMTNDDEVAGVTVTDGLNTDLATAVVNMELLAAAYVLKQMPFRGILGGTSYSGVAADLVDYTDGTSNERTCIVLGDTITGNGAALGLVLGSAAALPVQRKISRVKNGNLPIAAAWVGTDTVEDTGTDMAVIAERGYITFTTYPRKAGYFWAGDPALTATNDDYSMLARGRIIDKLHVLAYEVYVDEVDDEVPVDPGTGKMDAGFCTWLEQQVENQVNNTMTANKEIVEVSAFVDPNQNVLSTNIVNIVVKAVPVGYATEIDISLGFRNPALP